MNGLLTLLIIFAIFVVAKLSIDSARVIYAIVRGIIDGKKISNYKRK